MIMHMGKTRCMNSQGESLQFKDTSARYSSMHLQPQQSGHRDRSIPGYRARLCHQKEEDVSSVTLLAAKVDLANNDGYAGVPFPRHHSGCVPPEAVHSEEKEPGRLASSQGRLVSKQSSPWREHKSHLNYTRRSINFVCVDFG